MLFLIALIFRAISIEFRSKENMLWWRKMWDISYSISSIIIALALGIVLGNVLIGIAIDAQGNYQGKTLDFLNPFSLLTGVTTLALFMMHGAIYLVMKTEKRLYTKLTLIVRDTTVFFVITILLLSFYTLLYIPHLTNSIKNNPWLFVIPIAMVLATANVARRISQQRYRLAFFSSAINIALLLVVVAVNLYPNIVLSTIDPNFNLTVANSSASQKSLSILLTVAAIGIPLVATYTTFVFWTFKGKVELDEMSY